MRRSKPKPDPPTPRPCSSPTLLQDPDGSLHKFINVYVNSDEISDHEGEATSLKGGDDVSIIDPAPAVARELRRRLDEAQLLAGPTATPSLSAFTTGAPERFGAQLQVLGETTVPVRGLALHTDPVLMESGSTSA